MAGIKNKKDFLNKTLLFIIKLLNNNNITDWFIGYGTLLGIIRENSCINGDDDIDIICNKKNYSVIKELLNNNNFIFEYEYKINDSQNILKTKSNSNYCSVDFYMCDVDKNGNFNDLWEKVIWSECYIDNKNNKLIEYNWNNNILYIPNNYEVKLINRYGNDWRIPKISKGIFPKKKIL
jgi:phosphorylcholine metabolism protein LicD